MQKCFLNRDKGSLPIPLCSIPCVIVQSPRSKACYKLLHLLFGRSLNFIFIHTGTIESLGFHYWVTVITSGVLEQVSKLYVVSLNLFYESDELVFWWWNRIVPYPAVACKMKKVLARIYWLIHVSRKSRSYFQTCCGVTDCRLQCSRGRFWYWSWSAICKMRWRLCLIFTMLSKFHRKQNS